MTANSSQNVSNHVKYGAGWIAQSGTSEGHLKVNIENALTLDKTGLATDTLQTSGNASLSSMDTKLVACDTGAVVVASGTMSVSNFPATQPVSGSVSVSNFPTTQPVSAVALPLPTNAATDTLQTSGNASLTELQASVYTDGDAFGVSDKGVMIMGKNNSNVAKPIHITTNGDVEVEIADFVKGQALMASSFPVVLASDRSTLNVQQSDVVARGSEIMYQQMRP